MSFPVGKKVFTHKNKNNRTYKPMGDGSLIMIENVPVTMKRSRPFTRKICFATGKPIKAFEIAYKRIINVVYGSENLTQVDWVSEEGYTYLILQGREDEKLWTVDLIQDRLL